MADTEGDRLVLAWVQGVLDRRVRYRPLTVEETAEAIAEIRAVTTRHELLAEVAGIRRGMAPYRVPPQEADRYERMSALLIEAFGLDLAEVEKLAEVGRKRVDTARAIPEHRVSAVDAEGPQRGGTEG